MNMMVPQVPVAWNPGRQIVDLGQGGPASHMQILAAAILPAPSPCGWKSGLGGMPRQVLGPTIPVAVNRYSDPRVFNNLEIAGLMKSPIATAI